MKEIQGTCHICGQNKKLTFEHIPPHKAFNNLPAKVYNGGELLKKYKGEPYKYQNMQKGKGGYTLCEECNNNTGSWYAEEYIEIALVTAYAIKDYEPMNVGTAIHFHTDKYRPLSFIKQIIAMFCSTLYIEDVQLLGFDKLLLNKTSNEIDKAKFDIRMYLTNVKNGQFQTGKMELLKQNDSSIYVQNIAEIGAYPFGFILNMTPEHPIEEGISIMWMLDTEYGINYNVEIDIPYLEKKDINNPFNIGFKK